MLAQPFFYAQRGCVKTLAQPLSIRRKMKIMLSLKQQYFLSKIL